MTPSDPVALAKTWITQARRVVVLTSAGISTGSGILDFRGPQVRRAAWRRRPAVMSSRIGDLLPQLCAG